MCIVYGKYTYWNMECSLDQNIIYTRYYSYYYRQGLTMLLMCQTKHHRSLNKMAGRFTGGWGDAPFVITM